MSVMEQNRKPRILLGASNNALVYLFGINGLIGGTLQFIHVMYAIGNRGMKGYPGTAEKFLSLPADFNQFISHPWTLFTFMFTHTSFWMLLSNMVWLWAFASVMQDLAGNKKIIPLYLYGGWAGALLYMLAYNVIGQLEPSMPTALLAGAGASITALAIAITLLAPDYRFFPMIGGGIPIWIITLAYLIISFAALSYDPGLIISNIAGVVIGWLFVLALRRGSDWSDWMNRVYDWGNNLFNPNKPSKKTAAKEILFYESKETPYKKTANITQQKVDEILDKINQKGFRFLTDEEKDILRRAGEGDI
jgi:membrane associated rhomboid family serine protease